MDVVPCITFKEQENTVLPKRETQGSFGYDLTVSEDVSVPPRNAARIKTGLYLSQDLPCEHDLGVAMLILPRSSTLQKYGLIVGNSPGLIDADYGEEIEILVYNLTDQHILVAKGLRIAQALFVPVLLPCMGSVVPSEDDERSRQGFGSTGE